MFLWFNCPTYVVMFDACSSFTILQHLAVWGNLAAFYVINWIFSALPSSGMYTIMFRLCRQPSYWIAIFVSTFVHLLHPMESSLWFFFLSFTRNSSSCGTPIIALFSISFSLLVHKISQSLLKSCPKIWLNSIYISSLFPDKIQISASLLNME